MMASSRKPHLLAAGSWSGLSALWWSSHQAKISTNPSSATDRGTKSGSVDRNMQEKGEAQEGQAGDAPQSWQMIVPRQKTAFWWGSGPQMLLVQQPGQLIQSHEALGGHGDMMARSCHHHGHLRFGS